MRAQSALSAIARTTHESALGFGIVGVRIVFGLSCLALGGSLATVFASSCFWIPTLITSFDACGGVGPVAASAYFWVSGLLLVVGLFVRPVSIFLALSLLVMLSAPLLGVPPGATWPLTSASWLMLAVSCLLVAGGAGNIYGLNGLIYRNLRRHTWLSRFFLG